MLAENIAQWKEQYREEGRKEVSGLFLRTLLEKRFGALPDSVTSYIENASDSDSLMNFALFATQAQSLQAVTDQIKLMTGTGSSGHTFQPA